MEQVDRTGVLLPRVTRDTPATPQQVWDLLSDGWSLAGWVGGASPIRTVDQGWPRPWACIHHSVGSCLAFTNDSTRVIVAAAPHRLMLRARAWPLTEATVDITIVRLGRCAQTTLTATTSHGPGRLKPLPVQWALIAPRNRQCLRRLALLADGRTG